MKIIETRVFRGPNFYSRYHTVIRLTLDLEEMEAYPSDLLGDFTDRLVERLPSLWEHRCSEGVPGGFIARMRRGTWIGHIIEHVALELQAIAGTPVTFGKTRGHGEEGVYLVVIEYLEEKVGLAATELAIRLVRSLLPSKLPSAMSPEERAAFDYPKELENLTRLTARLALGPSTRALVEAAHKRGIPTIRLNEESLVQLGYGKYQQRVLATVTSRTSSIAEAVAQDKALTNRLLLRAGVPAPRQELVYSADEAAEAAQDLGYPLVTKPLNLNHGRGISLNLGDEAALREGFRQTDALGGTPVVVETFLSGSDYRVLVVNDRVVAVAERIPGQIIGDGVHTIGELVEILNADPRRGLDHEKVLTRIVIDRPARQLMEQACVTLATVLPAGQPFRLRATANLSTGGTAIDRTDEIHPENAELCLRAARTVGLDVAGIDLICPDIRQSLRVTGGGIVEVNAGPGFRMHLAPSEGKPRDVAGPVIDMLYPPGTPARIPIAAITGTNGKTTTTFMVGHILRAAGYHVGLTSTDGIYIDGKRYLKGDLTGPGSARMVLQDATIDAAVLETARGGILREGLGFDQCDVGAILNVTADHLGLRGVETVEQMALVKSLVIEAVSPKGCAVLNADDPLVVSLAEISPGKPFYFTMSAKNELVREHILQGGKAAVLEDGIYGSMLTLYDRKKHIPVLWAHEIPATLEGQARFNIANALAAAAIAYGLGARVSDIRQGLATFTANLSQVPGRLNVYDIADTRVIIDYAHNAAALRAIGQVVQAMGRARNIGVFSAPGDRRDEDIRDLGRICAGVFQELIIKEDADHRGRAVGEIAALIRAGALEAGLPAGRISIHLEEPQAVAAALERARPGDLILVNADETEAVWDQVTTWKPKESARRKNSKPRVDEPISALTKSRPRGVEEGREEVPVRRRVR